VWGALLGDGFCVTSLESSFEGDTLSLTMSCSLPRLMPISCSFVVPGYSLSDSGLGG